MLSAYNIHNDQRLLPHFGSALDGVSAIRLDLLRHDLLGGRLGPQGHHEAGWVHRVIIRQAGSVEPSENLTGSEAIKRLLPREQKQRLSQEQEQSQNLNKRTGQGLT